MAHKDIINKSTGVTHTFQSNVPLPEGQAKPQLANLSLKIRLHHSADRSAAQAATMRNKGFTGHTSDMASQLGIGGHYQRPATSLGGKMLQGLSGATTLSTELASKTLQSPPDVERRGRDRRQGQERRQGNLANR